MDRMPDWRPVEPAGPDGRAGPEVAARADTAISWRPVALAALCLAGLAAGALALSVATPSGQLSFEPVLAAVSPTPEPERSAAAAPETIVVDVQGAVERPGLYRLPAGSRVGEAIDLAGGYSATVDLEVAAQRINLAERMADGAKVHVPRRGEQPLATQPEPAATQPGGGTAGGPVDVNSADQRTLETLPGIGPVTAAKIIAARAEAPFASVDDLLARKVVGTATFEKIRELISTGP